MPVLGERLRELRLGAGLSQRALAAQVGVSFPHISKIEAGSEIPSDDLLIKIARVVGEDPDRLLLFAARMPEEVRQQVVENPQLALQFFRRWRAGEITNEQVERLGKDEER